jgi:hypothetical protein
LRPIRAAVVALDFADADHVVRIPDFASLPLRDHVHRIAGKSGNRREIPEINGRDAGSIAVPGGFDAEITVVGFGDLDDAMGFGDGPYAISRKSA